MKGIADLRSGKKTGKVEEGERKSEIVKSKEMPPKINEEEMESTEKLKINSYPN